MALRIDWTHVNLPEIVTKLNEIRKRFAFCNAIVNTPFDLAEHSYRVPAVNGIYLGLKPSLAAKVFMAQVDISRSTLTVLLRDFNAAVEIPSNLHEVPQEILHRAYPYIPKGILPPMINSFEDNGLRRMFATPDQLENEWNHVREAFRHNIYFLALLYHKHQHSPAFRGLWTRLLSSDSLIPDLIAQHSTFSDYRGPTVTQRLLEIPILKEYHNSPYNYKKTLELADLILFTDDPLPQVNVTPVPLPSSSPIPSPRSVTAPRVTSSAAPPLGEKPIEDAITLDRLNSPPISHTSSPINPDPTSPVHQPATQGLKHEDVMRRIGGVESVIDYLDTLVTPLYHDHPTSRLSILTAFAHLFDHMGLDQGFEHHLAEVTRVQYEADRVHHDSQITFPGLRDEDLEDLYYDAEHEVTTHTIHSIIDTRTFFDDSDDSDTSSDSTERAYYPADVDSNSDESEFNEDFIYHCIYNPIRGEVLLTEDQWARYQFMLNHAVVVPASSAA